MDNLVDQFILAVPEPAYRFKLWRIVSASLGQFDAARAEKIPNAIVTRLSVHVEPVIIGKIEGAKRFTPVCRALSQIFVEHLFPARGVYSGSIGYYTFEVEKDRIVSIAGDHMRAVFVHRAAPEHTRFNT
jgi:hypothetical protein